MTQQLTKEQLEDHIQRLKDALIEVNKAMYGIHEMAHEMYIDKIQKETMLEILEKELKAL